MSFSVSFTSISLMRSRTILLMSIESSIFGRGSFIIVQYIDSTVFTACASTHRDLQAICIQACLGYCQPHCHPCSTQSPHRCSSYLFIILIPPPKSVIRLLASRKSSFIIILLLCEKPK